MSTQDQLAAHLGVIFGPPINSGTPTGFVNFRGIGEKGTDGEGTFREDKFVDASTAAGPFLLRWGIDHVTRWNQHGRGSFIVPAMLSQAKGSSENVSWFHCVLVDLDSGDIQSKQEHLAKHIGEPTAIVYSGGEINGQRKRHLYWTLTAPCYDVQKVVQLRDTLARKGGGDTQFGLGVPTNPYGRAHQPVRLAGSVHNKNGKPNPVVLEFAKGAQVYDIDIMVERSVTMPRHDGAVAEQASGQLFHPERGELDLTEDVHEGGDEEKNRWSQFSRVAGHYLHCVRQEQMSLDEAKASTSGWMTAHMLPAWPVARFDQEWHALMQRDLASHGPFPEPAKPMVADGQGLEIWAAHRWSLSPKPQRRFLVDGLIQAAKPQVLVAEGSAGKTFLMLDLALKVAAHEDGDEDTWCGNPVREGGTVVILTTEDDKDELHIRLHDIDPGRRREKAGDRLIILPTINAGGAFAIVDRDPKTQEARPSKRWAEFFALLKRLPDLKLVVVDTLNTMLHGEENSAVVINEFLRVASQVCGDLGAALVFTHHVRKQGNEPIRTADDMLAAMRGSSAIPSNTRGTLGIWHCPDYDRRMLAMGLQPRRKMLWKLAVLKANNPEMLQGEKTLLRQDSGLLLDVTERDPFAGSNNMERHAWLALAIEQAARAGHPYSVDGKNSKSGLYRRRNELPQALRQVGPAEFTHIVDDLLLRKAVVACAARGGKEKKWLDIQGGPIATDEAGAELASGAYRPGRWEDWTYDPALSCCVRA